MFEKLFNIIKEAIEKFKPVSNEELSTVIYPIADKMKNALDVWLKMYSDNAPWLDAQEGIKSYGIPATVCEELTRYVLTEMDSHIVEAGNIESDKMHDDSSDKEPTNRAEWLDKVYHQRLLSNITEILEIAMALGGFIVKPYISTNGIHYDICYQGQFVPIAFDDDGNITDIAFHDTFTNGSIRYTKVERHSFDASNRTITISNRAYKCKIHSNNSDYEELGMEIPLTAVDRWANVEADVEIANVDRPMYGYYKPPIANNIDIKCPLGVSVFHKASNLIESADRQYSRLDWEYDAGQIAIDVDPTAIQGQKGYYNTLQMDEGRNRVYRKIDLGSDETYHEFAPTLRDTSYINGLNMYLIRIEDICGLARGTISTMEQVARTATEILSLKQRTFATVHAHQNALQKCLEDAIYATNIIAEYYADELDAKSGDYVMNTEWSDSAIVDTYTELEQRMNLMREGVVSKAEVRAWYTGEDMETAQANIDKIASENNNGMMNDIFNSVPEMTIEA